MRLEERKHWQVVAAFSLLEEEAPDLADYVNPAAREFLQREVDALSQIKPENREEELKQYLQALRSGDDFSGLAEIHPAWLLSVLKDESPRVIGVVLRHLPSKHVRYLLEYLPRRLCMELPKLIEAFYVPTELLDVLRRRVEKHFLPIPISHQITTFTFDNLYYLKIEELESLFHDLGMSELSLSLVHSSKQIVRIILNRFSIREAKEILKRIKFYQVESGWFLKDARYSVLELGKGEVGPARFFMELGLSAVAKALGLEEEKLTQALCQKMTPARAALLKRHWEEAKGVANPEKLAKRQAWILDHLRRLSVEEKIDSFWAGCFPVEVAA